MSEPSSEAATPSAAAGITGIMGACLTPFDESGGIDFAALERQLEFLVPDCDAIAVAAVEAAEYAVLTVRQRKELLRQATAVVDRRVPVVLGASAPAVGAVLELAEWSAEVGGDMVQVLMPSRPWGAGASGPELLDFFSQVTEGSPLPVVAYHNPARGSDPPPEVWVELSRLPGIGCFKESSRDMTKIARLVEQIDVAGHARYFTTMQPLLITLLLGGSGATMPAPGTRIGAQVVRAFRAGDLERARLWQRLYSIFPGRWGSYGLAPVMKAALRHFGVDSGAPAAPYAPVSPAHDRQIEQFLRDSGLLDDAVTADRVDAAIGGSS